MLRVDTKTSKTFKKGSLVETVPLLNGIKGVLFSREVRRGLMSNFRTKRTNEQF